LPEAKKELEEIGEKVLKDLENGENPYLDIPVRSLSNVEYDEKSGMLRLKEEKPAKRFLFHTGHAKKFMQTMLVSAFCKELLDQGLHTSLRDLYYALKTTLPNSSENTFNEQSESDPIVIDLEVALKILREQLHLSADVRGRVVGNLTIRDRGDSINLARLGSGGWAVPSNVEDIEFRNVDAEFILVVEKNAAFERLNEDKFWQDPDHECIIITTQGQAARGARRLIQRLASEKNLPVHVFTDADPYGWYIYFVIKYGSISLAHVSDRLGTPNAKFLGLSISDIERFNLQKYTIKAEDVDVKRAQEMLDYEWIKNRPAWQAELNLMIKKKIKAELEALSGRGLKYMTQEYLPNKLKEKENQLD
jgi:DNA topoisomerase-6 subunit A